MTQGIDPLAALFGQMAAAGPQGVTGNGIKVEGEYVVRVKETKGHKGYHGNKFIIEFEVLESSTPNEVPVGSTRSASLKWGDTKALADLKAFGLAAWHSELSAFPEQQRGLFVSFAVHAMAGSELAGEAANIARQQLGQLGQKPDLFAGRIVRVSTKPRVSKPPANNPYTVYLWNAYEPKAG